MGRITVTNVLEATKQTNMYDIVNAIRNSSSNYFKEFVPLANATNIAEVGAGITLNQQTQNEFINALVNRIGLVIIRTAILKNPLSRFKQGTLDLGQTIEEIFTDLCAEHIYDPFKAETEVFMREIPDVKTLYHELNRQGFYKQTIQEDTLKQAFISWEKFGSFTASIVQAMYNSAEVDEYKYMKLLLDAYFAKGHFKTIRIPDANTYPLEAVKEARKYATLVTMPQGSRKYNSLNVHTTTAPEDLLIIITAELSAIMDVDVLAKSFNLDRATFLGNQIVLDELGTNPETGDKIEMILIDKKFFMVFDNLFRMTSQYNAEGLYWNYFLHVWQVISGSRFANAIAFVSNPSTDPTPVLQEVVLSPSIQEIRGAQPKQFKVHVSYTETGVKPEIDLTYQVLNAETLQPVTTGVTLTPNATGFTLQLLAAAPSKVIVVATATHILVPAEGQTPAVTETKTGRGYYTKR